MNGSGSIVYPLILTNLVILFFIRIIRTLLNYKTILGSMFYWTSLPHKVSRCSYRWTPNLEPIYQCNS